MADEKISQLSDAGAPQSSDQFVIARAGSSLSILWSALSAAAGGAVSSVFGRTGAVTAQTGDYTAAQVGALPSTETLDQIATANATAASVAMNSHKLTGLAAGTTNGDSVRYEQIPTALPPNGSAGGDLSGTYPNPAVKAITETSGPTDLTIGTITDGQFLKRSGSTLVSAAAGSGTVTSVTSADTSISVATTTTTPVLTVAALNTIAANHATSGSVDMNSNKLTGLANGSAASDSAAFGQIPVAGTGFPAGQLGLTQFINLNFTTNSSTAVLITDGATKVLTSTVTVPAGGRSVKITVQIPQIENSAGSDVAELTIWRGTVGSGTLIASFAVGGGAGLPNNTQFPGVLVGVDTPSSGSVTYNVGLNQVLGGTAQVFSPNTAGKPMTLLVEGI